MSYAQSIDGLNIDVTTGKLAQSIDSLDMLLSTSEGAVQDGIVLISPANGEINVSVTPSFDWSDSNNYPAYKIEIADNEQFMNAITAYITSSDYAQTEALLNATNYHWRVVGGNVTDRPAIVPDSGVAEMTVWDANNNPATIYVPNDIYINEPNAPDGVAPLVLQAANELADYIELSSGTKPQVIQVASDHIFSDKRHIKVGFPNNLTEYEETLIKCGENGPLELTGVDVFDPNNTTYAPNATFKAREFNYMSQAGTYNAVMSFLHEYVGVVWGWMGSLGEAVPTHSSLLIPPVNKQHSPSAEVRAQLLMFSSIGNSSPYGTGKEWLKRQRCFFCRDVDESHGFRDYYDRFHPLGPNVLNLQPSELREDIFALQTNDSRNGYPFGRSSKMEVGEPALDDLWIQVNVEEGIEDNPLIKVFSCGAGDYYTAGHSVDPRAQVLDYPVRGTATGGDTTKIIDTRRNDVTTNSLAGETIKIIDGTNNGETRTVVSNTTSEIVVDSSYPISIDGTSVYEIQKNDTVYFDYVYEGENLTAPTITDRELKFAKRLLAKLDAEYPNNDFVVNTLAYGPTETAPKREGIDDRIYVLNTALNFTNPNSGSTVPGKTAEQNLEDWLDAWGGNQIWRANLGEGSGHQSGVWFVKARDRGAYYKDILGRGCTGVFFDAIWEHWSTQWPTYYVMAQLSWNKDQNISDILDKAYNTLFGDAADAIKAYYDIAEDVNVQKAIHRASYRDRVKIWTPSIIDQLEAQINIAKTLVDPVSDEYERIEWVEVGFIWAKGVIQSYQYWVDYNSPAIATSDVNIANGSNAVEDDTNSLNGWTSQGNPSVVVSNETNNSNFAFYIDCADQVTITELHRDAQLPGTVDDLYLISFDAKHSGSGGRLRFFTEDPSGNFSYTGQEVTSDFDFWKTYQFTAKGTDRIYIRDWGGNDGAAWFDNLVIQEAVPVDQQAIETEWLAHNQTIMDLVFDPKWDETNRPIGRAVQAGWPGELPEPGDPDVKRPSVGFE